MRLLKIHYNLIPAGIYRRNWSSRLCVQNASCTVHTGDLTYLGGGVQMLRPQSRHRSGMHLLVFIHILVERTKPLAVVGIVRPRPPSVPKRLLPGRINALDVCGPCWFAAGVAFLFGVCCTAHRNGNCSSFVTLDEATG